MAEISSGNKDDKNMEKGGSFKLFGRSPARSFSRKKSNPLSRMFGSRKKPEEVPNIADAEGDASSSSDDESGKRGEVDTVVPTTPKIAEEKTIPQVTPQVAQPPNIETFVQEMVSAKYPEAESKESTQASVEKKPKLLGQLLEKAEKTKDELLGKAEKTKDELLGKAEKTKDELLERGNESVQQVFNAFTHTNKAPVEQPKVEDKGTSQETSVNTIIDQVKGANIAERLRDEVVAVVGVMQGQKVETSQEEPKEETSQEEPKEVSRGGENQENANEEENCVATLAQGLQKICSTWNTKKED